MTFIVVGMCIGIVLTIAQVPHVSWPPPVVATVSMASAVFGFQEMALISFPEALSLLISTLLTAALSAGMLWDREKLDPEATIWNWAWRELTNPGYARALYRERQHSPVSNEAKQSHN